MSDIAEQVLAAIESAEGSVPPLRLEGRYVGPRTDAERALLRRCAADREIVSLHSPIATKWLGETEALACKTCGTHWEYPVAWPCSTILIMARGYGLKETG